MTLPALLAHRTFAVSFTMSSILPHVAAHPEELPHVPLQELEVVLLTVIIIFYLLIQSLQGLHDVIDGVEKAVDVLPASCATHTIILLQFWPIIF